MMSPTIHINMPDRVANLTVREFLELLRVNEFDSAAWDVTAFSRRLNSKRTGKPDSFSKLAEAQRSLNSMGY